MKTRKPLTRRDLLAMILNKLRKEVYSSLGKNNGRLTTEQIEALCKYRRGLAIVNLENKDI